jgi:uncharacterized protein YjiK
MSYVIKVLPLVLLMCSCANVGSQVWKINADASHRYEYAKPSNEWELHYDLQEISGLDYDQSENQLLAINDEKGKVYQINLETGDSKVKYHFHKNGDYEGIAKVGKHIYVLKSNGKLYRYNTEKQKTKEMETGLSSKNDAEGLCYDRDKNSLLIACKGQTKDNKKGVKAIYRYDLDEKKMTSKKEIKIEVDNLEQLAKEHGLNTNQQWRLKRFSPSGIAIHPQTKSYYILSARGSLLLVYNEQQIAEYLVFLDTNALPQPEGICFDKDGNLFISSEGKGEGGKLLMYKWMDQ